MNEYIIGIIKLIPMLISTLILMIISFSPIRKDKKIIALIMAFILVIVVTGVTWFVFWK